MSKPQTPALNRRHVFAGAGVAGAAAVAAALLPRATPPAAAAPASDKPVAEVGGGYRLSAHVLRYYGTTRL